MRWEGRTMRSGTSCFNGAVFKKTLARFWPLWAVNLVFWVIALPLRALLRLHLQESDSMLRFAYTAVTDVTGGILGTVITALGAILVAMAVCSHLYSTRSANFMGTMPVRREGLFLSHYLAGLAMLLGPNCLVFLLTLVIEAAGGSLALAPLAWWLAVSCGMYFFFYSFAVCVGMFTGNIVALPVFYAVFNFLCGGFYLLLNWLMERFYYGFAGFDALETAAEWLTPPVLLGGRVRADYHIIVPADGGTAGRSYLLEAQGGKELAIYAAAGLVLAVCALLLYRRRQLETAGDVVAVRAMRPVFRYGVAVCGGLALGLLVSTVLGLGEWGMMVSILLWGVAACFVAQMLLDKTFRVFRKWKGSAAVALAFIALFLVVGLDLTGYEHRVPDAGGVVSVSVSGLSLPPYDDGCYLQGLLLTKEEDIARVTALHEAIAQAGENDPPDWNDRFSLRVTYRLKNGGTLVRYYQSVPIRRADEGVPGSVTALMLALNRSPAVSRGRYEVMLSAAEDPDRRLEYATVANCDLSGEDARTLWAAVEQDFAEGNIGVHAPSWSQPETEYNMQLTFSWSYSADWKNTQWVGWSIAVQETSVRTRAALEELGRALDPDFDVDAFLSGLAYWPQLAD